MYSRKKKKKKGAEKGRMVKPHLQRLTVNELCFQNITEKTNLMTHGKCFTCIQRAPKDAVFQVRSAVDCNISINCRLYPLSCC